MAGGESKAPAAEQAAPEYGAKYQQHMGTLQKQLEEAKQTWAFLSPALPALLPHSFSPPQWHCAVPKESASSAHPVGSWHKAIEVTQSVQPAPAESADTSQDREDAEGGAEGGQR